MVLFRRTRTAITVTEMIVIERMIAIRSRTPTETPNVRPLTANELESPVTATVAALLLGIISFNLYGHQGTTIIIILLSTIISESSILDMV